MMIHTIYTCISYTGSKENHIFFSKSTRVITEILLKVALNTINQAESRDKGKKGSK
jgi:hypothetical protein